MEIKWVLIFIVAIVFSFIFGWALSKYLNKKSNDGMIFIEPTEDGERERIRFVLNMELDDIKKKMFLIFKVNVTDVSQ